MKKYDALVVFGISLVICTSFIGMYPIYILDEARNSEAAREMLVSGNYIVPYFNGQLRTDKPPLHYFFMILGYKLFGVNSFGARFFSGVFGALTLLITYLSVKKWQNPVLALITVTILWSSLFFVQEFHLAVPDPYLIFFNSLSLFSFFNHFKTKKNVWLLPFYGGMALGMLTKGPIAIALPALVIPVFLWSKKDFKIKSILGIKPFLGLILMLLVTVPWYYQVHVETGGEWTKGFFLDHNLSRFGSEKEGHGGLFIITPMYVLLGLLPFSVFIIQGFQKAWKARKENDFMLFSFLVSIITILFFSISSTKLPNYPMPCYPFVAILIAFYLYQMYVGIKSKTLLWSLVFLLIIGIALPIGGFIVLGVEEQFLEVRNVSFMLLLTTFAAIFGLHFYRKDDFKKAFLGIANGWILTGLCLFRIIYPILTQQSPVSMALQKIPKESDIVAFKRFDSAFPINFQRTFTVFDSMEDINIYLEDNPDTYIITNTRSKEDLKQLERFQLILEQKALFENHTTRIYIK
ncbi:glycosyltransferase family 39 protein [Muricauda sp. CAU 1633]|uniref:ArnT family glycosyltransferase n=1 Tax=Allomuricauda sp. CAU 1633 TaxID=2816036 RepID=UPI001A8DA7ED|nr:glycosyltransferase family 39 protein [Muricauda sp. CAU 1633]MBO0324040.1 glycosyltransferase family 39 protein [Muricauda sp. CAU 1633]